MLNKIDKVTLNMLVERLNIEPNEVIDLALRELSLNVMSEENIDEIQNQYKNIIKDIRMRLFDVYKGVNKGVVTNKQAQDELNICDKLIKSFNELMKADGNINGFLVNYENKVNLFLREKELWLKMKDQDTKTKIAEHSIAMGMLKLGEEV